MEVIVRGGVCWEDIVEEAGSIKRCFSRISQNKWVTPILEGAADTDRQPYLVRKK